MLNKPLRPRFMSTYSLGQCHNSVLNVKALIGAFNQEKALVQGLLKSSHNLRKPLFKALMERWRDGELQRGGTQFPSRPARHKWSKETKNQFSPTHTTSSSQQWRLASAVTPVFSPLLLFVLLSGTWKARKDALCKVSSFASSFRETACLCTNPHLLLKDSLDFMNIVSCGLRAAGGSHFPLFSPFVNIFIRASSRQQSGFSNI